MNKTPSNWREKLKSDQIEGFHQRFDAVDKDKLQLIQPLLEKSCLFTVFFIMPMVNFAKFCLKPKSLYKDRFISDRQTKAH